MNSQEYLKNVSMCKNSVMEEQISENMYQETDEKEDTNPERIMLEKRKKRYYRKNCDCVCFCCCRCYFR